MQTYFQKIITVIFLITVFQNAMAQSWSLAGNNNASANSRLGTTNNISLRFYTNNVQRMRIDSEAGWVGIGTLTPTDRLHVNSASSANAFRAQVNGLTKFLVHSGGGVAVGGNGTPPVNGLYVAGDVGIGVAFPTHELHVEGRARFTKGLIANEGGITSTNTVGDGVSGTRSSSYGSGLRGSGYRGVYATGSNYGVYAVANNGYSGSVGVYAKGYYGVEADGAVGVLGTGGTGIYGVGTGASGIGVYGSGYDVGVYGISSQWAGEFQGDILASGNLYQGSDRSLKQDITDMSSAMDMINKLKPKSYRYRQDGAYKLMNLPQGKHYGLIAQDVEEVLPGLVKAAKFDAGKAVQATKGKDSTQAVTQKPSEIIAFKAVNYTELIPVVVKGMQELQQENNELKARLAQMEERMDKLAGSRSVTTVTGMLGQNVPNPAHSSVRISYSLPSGAGRGQLLLTDAAGKAIKAVPLAASGVVDLNTALLASGTYTYSLMVNGKILETKKLAVVR